MQVTDVWIYRDKGQLGYDPTSGRDIVGFKVEALDGSIGKIDEATNDVGESFVIVDTGPWIFGKKVMLPAGVDPANRRGRGEGLGQPHQGPDQERTRVRRAEPADKGRRHEIGSYYGAGGPGYRDWDDQV